MWPAAGLSLADAAEAQQILEGNITEDTFLQRDITYVLRGTVFVREPARLRPDASAVPEGTPASFLGGIENRGANAALKGLVARFKVVAARSF